MSVAFLILFLFTILAVKLSYNLDNVSLSKVQIKKSIWILSVAILIDLVFIYIIDVEFLSMVALIIVITIMYRIIELIKKIQKM